MLYDLTSSYVEGTHCPLAQRGHSRDGKKGTLQIVFGLLCTAEGCPVAVEVFEGSTVDPLTVTSQVAKIRDRFGLQQVVLVGDRGMLTAARIREDLQGVEGLRWITTLRAPTIRKLVNAGTVTPSLFDERDLAEVTSDEFPTATGERLVVCRNPLLAAERRRKRDELLAATEEDLAPIAAATRRENKPLRGAAAIGVRVGKEINRYKMAKHFVTEITDESFTFRRNEAKIAAEQQLDGIYIVRSNVEPERFDAAQTVRAYKDLSKVERAFRCFKSVDLKVRPLHHRRADRVRAHVQSCCACWPTTSSGTCAGPSRRCSSTTTTRPRPSSSALLWSPPPAARPRRWPRPAANAPTTTCRCTASGRCSPTSGRWRRTRCRSPAATPLSRCRHSPRRSSSAASSSWG